MSAIPGLKKKLKSVRATGKLSKAMKTVSAAKFSRLHLAWKTYAYYSEQLGSFERVETVEAYDAVVVFGSNRGFCGGFNHELLTYLHEKHPHPDRLLACGQELIRLLTEEDIHPEQEFILPDVPHFDDCTHMIDAVEALAGERRDYRVALVYPEFINTMTQTPRTELLLLNPGPKKVEEDDWLWLPDRASVEADLVDKSARALVFGAALKTALGAQASTLMTMRSAYDTATEYSAALENEIQRLRQSEVTSDVIETSSERGGKGETPNG